MNAAMTLAQASQDTTPPEPAWGHEAFEALSEDEVERVIRASLAAWEAA